MIEKYEKDLFEFAQQEMVQDPAHDINHVLRVVKNAQSLSSIEHACMEIVVPAAYLHDCFSFPKNHPDRAKSAIIAAEKAITFLQSIDYPATYLEGIHHAISAHSYSAKIKPQTLESQIVQDADRLDALGAIGIARCLQVSTCFGTPLYNHDDPFCAQRSPNDRNFTIDHFYVKLLNLENTMNTEAATAEAQRRTQFMRDYLKQLQIEVC